MSSNKASFNPFALSDKENFPSIDEVFTGAKSNAGSELVSLGGGASFHENASQLFSQSQMQQMKAAERSLKACNHEFWVSRGELSTDETGMLL